MYVYMFYEFLNLVDGRATVNPPSYQEHSDMGVTDKRHFSLFSEKTKEFCGEFIV